MSTARSPEALHDVIVERDVMVTMRDGVRLATDIFFPATGQERIPGAHAAVFHRTPYRKEDTEESLGFCRFFAQRGYIAVIQDCRGTFSSEGDVNFLIPEAEDGFDTLAWIDQQPWSNGKVGSWGTSWSSWTQTAMAALGPANLASMVPNMSGANAHESSVRHGGALELRFLAWIGDRSWKPPKTSQYPLFRCEASHIEPTVHRLVRSCQRLQRSIFFNKI